MGGHFAGPDWLVSRTLSNWIAVRAGDARSCCGPAGRSSCAAGPRCQPRNLNMFTLIAIGVGVAWTYSVVATLAPGSVSRRVPRHATAPSPSISRPRPSSPCWCCSGQVLELRRARADRRRDPRPARPRAEDARGACDADGQRRGGRARRRSHGRRPAARAAGRKDPGRRRGDGRRERRRRIDGDRRVDAGRRRRSGRS